MSKEPQEQHEERERRARELHETYHALKSDGAPLSDHLFADAPAGRREPSWTTGQAIGFICTVVGICAAVYGLGVWPVHNEWGWWPWSVCDTWAADPLTCVSGEEQGIRAITIIAGGAVLAFSGIIAFNKCKRR